MLLIAYFYLQTFRNLHSIKLYKYQHFEVRKNVNRMIVKTETTEVGL